MPIPAAPDPDLRQAAADASLTGFYRPEDASFDEVELAAGNVRLCEVNTGNESTDHLWGDVLCITDGTMSEAGRTPPRPKRSSSSRERRSSR